MIASTQVSERLAAENAKKSAQISELKAFVSRFSANASKSKQATSRARQIEKIKLEEVKPSSRKNPFIRFEQDRKLHRLAVTVKGLAMSFDEEAGNGYLLYEISHPYRNWTIILPKLRGFALKNLNHYRKHDKGPEALEKFSLLFLKAIGETKKNEVQLDMAVEAMLAYLEKVISVLSLKEVAVYESSLAFCFRQLLELEEGTMLFMVQGHHPIKKIAKEMLNKAGESEYDFTELARLMRTDSSPSWISISAISDSSSSSISFFTLRMSIVFKSQK